MYKDNDSNQYIVGFPWVNNKPSVHEELDSNYGLVLARFKDTMKTLDKDKDKLLQYKENHEKEAQMDFIEKVPLDELNDKRILKQFFRSQSATTKCRRVFDGC